MKDNVDYVYDEYAVSADVEKRWWSWWWWWWWECFCNDTAGGNNDYDDEYDNVQ